MSSTVEETLVLIKPDGVARSLTGEILRRIEAKGYQLVDVGCCRLSVTCSPGTTPSTRVNRFTSRSSSSWKAVRSWRCASRATA